MLVVSAEPKRLANLDKHGLDFAAFETGFSFDRALAVQVSASRVTGRERVMLIGTLNATLVVAAIVSPLGTEALSLMSLRPANARERKAYDRHR